MDQTYRRRSALLKIIATCCLPGQAFSTTVPGTELDIGVLPNISARVLLAQYKPFHDFMARRLGRDVALSTAPSWSVFHQRTMALDMMLS